MLGWGVVTLGGGYSSVERGGVARWGWGQGVGSGIGVRLYAGSGRAWRLGLGRGQLVVRMDGAGPSLGRGPRSQEHRWVGAMLGLGAGKVV